MDFVEQLKIFVAVAEAGSFARAAESLRMARPSVTNAIAGLERSVGARLLHRTTRRTTLTGEGEVFFDRAVQLLGDVVETRNLFGGSGEAPRGRLRVDITVALARPLIIPRLTEFCALYPEIDLVLGVSDNPVDLVAEGIDCVLRLGELSPSSLISRTIGRVSMITCASPAYLAAHGTPRSIEDLASHSAVIFFSGRNRRAMDLHFMEQGRQRSVKMRPGIMVNDSEAYVACAISGFGVIQPLYASVAEHLAAGRLVEILSADKVPSRPLSILYPNRQYLAPQVRAFIDWVTTILASADDSWVTRP